jgi:hypothetical protein
MSEQARVAMRLALLRAIRDWLKEQDDEVRAEALAVFQPGDRVSADMDGETSVGTVSCVAGQIGWKVADEDAFLAWVKVNHPPAIETVERVHPVDRAQILESIETAGIVPDGVQMKHTEPGMRVQQSAEQRALVQSWDWRKWLVEASGRKGIEG